MDGMVTASKKQSNPFLAGNFAPIRSEDDFTLTLTGEIPSGLAGVLYRNGPNPQFPPRDDQYHWFIGDGMIHAFEIGQGQVRYRNRWVRTEKFNAEHAAGMALWGSWGNPQTTDPSVLGTDGGVANTNILHHAGRLLALEEAHAPVALDPVSLLSPEGPAGGADFGGRVTAHPKFDPATGEMVFFAYADSPMPLSATISWGVVDRHGKLLKRESFEAPYCSMVHDFMLTESHVLIPVLPLRGDLMRAAGGGPVFAWEPDQPARIAVMRRSEGVASLRWFDVPACYVFHIMNAYEQDGRVIADVMRYANAPLFPLADGSKGKDAPAFLTRWEFDLAGHTPVRETQLDDLPGEFPRFDPRHEGSAYRHGWFAAQSRNSRGIVMDSIAHIDLATGQRSTYTAPNGDALTEPVFVPAHAQAPEGEGWLLSVAWRAAENCSELLILPAQAVEQGPVAIARLPRRVPFGFHGNFVSA